MALDEPQTDDDIQVINEVQFAIDPMIKQFIENITIDLQETRRGKGLIMRNAPGGAC